MDSFKPRKIKALILTLRPYLEYCVPFWVFYFKKKKEEEEVQRSARNLLIRELETKPAKRNGKNRKKFSSESSKKSKKSDCQRKGNEEWLKELEKFNLEKIKPKEVITAFFKLLKGLHTEVGQHLFSSVPDCKTGNNGLNFEQEDQLHVGINHLEMWWFTPLLTGWDHFLGMVSYRFML